MARKIFASALLFTLIGCSSSYLVVKERKGVLENYQGIDVENLTFVPLEQGKEKEEIRILVEYVPEEKLNKIFRDKKVFGRYAGGNPYPKGFIVFKIKIENKSSSKIQINPQEFVVLDDLGTQYLYINPEKIKEIYKSESFFYSFTKSTSSLAPGFYGTPADLAEGLATRRVNKKYALLKYIELTGGYVYPGVVYDGYISFIKPNPKAKNIKLILPNIKTKFDVNDEALGSVDFLFEFHRK